MTASAPSSTVRRTLFGIDAVYFLMADLETGVGPFLAIFLVSSRHWTAARVGLVVAVQSIVTVLAQAPAGALVDWSRHKKWLLVGATTCIGIGCYGVVRAPSLPLQILDQALIGVAAAVFVPAGAAVSLGVVKAARFPRRIGRMLAAMMVTMNAISAVSMRHVARRSCWQRCA
jgi:MFS family permease